MPDTGRSRPSRAAFTLLELLIVLAVLAGLAALSWPAVRGLLAKSELQSAAKQVRAALAKARLDAMESGTARQFRYQPGMGRFEIAALAALAEERSDAGSLAPDDRDSGAAVQNWLPSGVRFEESAAAGEPASSAGLVGAPGEESWSTPILFFPNGRTSNAKIRLRGRRDYQIDLSLRGVTGSVVMGKPEQGEDWP